MKIALVLQLQLFMLRRSALIVGTFGSRLMLPSPSRPPHDLFRGRPLAPDQPVDEPPHFRDGQREEVFGLSDFPRPLFF